MGDRKPKKNSSGSNVCHKAKEAKIQADRPAVAPRDDKSKAKKK